MKYLMLIIVATLSFTVGANELSLGLWSRHVERSAHPDKCTNEKHNLAAYTYKNFVAGGYKNSHCKQSFLVGYQDTIYKDLGYTVSLVSGYPKSMHVADEYVVVPMLHYTLWADNVGVRLYFIPNVLTAVGYMIRF